jgi:hypothetical protein
MRMLTGTKINLMYQIWVLSLVSFIVIYGCVRYGLVPAYWQNLSLIITALLGSGAGIYGVNEWRKKNIGGVLNDRDYGNVVTTERDTRPTDQR